MKPTKNVIELMPYAIRAMDILGCKKKWKPKIGDWVLWRGVVHLVVDVPFHRDAYDSHGGMRPG